ncbi:MAG: tetratricopeptide repeat protein [Gemmatimonadetes bacterium]|nr:tetratricopeptide repeat protein [Gemmatimonadota bacterium]
MSFSTRRAAAATGLSPKQIRGYVHAGVLHPTRGPRGAFRFSFQDVVVLRTGKQLNQAGVPTHRVWRALSQLDASTAGELSSMGMRTHRGRILVSAAGRTWDPLTDQLQLPLNSTSGTAVSVALAPPPAPETPDLFAEPGLFSRQFEREEPAPDTRPPDHAEWWFEEGLRLEERDAVGARSAYREAIAQDPGHAGAHANLGRLLHQLGDLARAERHYRQALLAEPDHGTAAFNLGVVLEDRGENGEALEAYERAIRSDVNLAEAHYNAGRLLEGQGQKAEALGHFAAYRRLVEGVSDPGSR